MSQWQSGTGCGGSIYAIEISQCYKSEPFFSPPESLLLSIYQHTTEPQSHQLFTSHVISHIDTEESTLVQVLQEEDTEMGWNNQGFYWVNICMREDRQLQRLGEPSDWCRVDPEWTRERREV